MPSIFIPIVDILSELLGAIKSSFSNEVIWQGEEIQNYEGAERLLRFSLNHSYRVEGNLPLS